MTSPPYWVRDAPLGPVAISPRPAPHDLLHDDLAAWRRSGADVVVSLLEDREAISLGLAAEPHLCARLGMDFHRFPIIDHGLPESIDRFLELVERLHAESARSRGIVAHCYAGIGRSTMVAASLLLRAGWTLDEGLRRLTAARGTPVPNTQEQIQWLRRIEARLRQTL